MNDKRVKICILGAGFNTGNMGVSVLAAGALRAALHSFPDAELIQFDYGRQPRECKFIFEGKPVKVRFVNIRFSKKLYLSNNIAVLLLVALLSKLIPFQAVRARLMSANSWLKELVESDFVLS